MVSETAEEARRREEEAKRRHDEANREQERISREWLKQNGHGKPGKK